MIITKDTKNNFVFTTEITFESLEGTTESITLRELNTTEQWQVMKAAKMNDNLDPTDPIGMMEQYERLFTNCVVNSSFTHEDGSPASGKEVYDILKSSGSLFQSILKRWIRGKEDGTENPLDSAPEKSGN